MDDIAMDNELAAWDDRQPAWEKQDPIWTLLAYRLSRFAMDLLKEDLRQARRVGVETRDQLNRAVASVAANLAEGHSRSSTKERAKFYNYALGSAREASVWYSSISDALPDGVADARLSILSRIKKLTYGLCRKADPPRWLGPRRRPAPPPPPPPPPAV
jgi:four helix bundle protein